MEQHSGFHKRALIVVLGVVVLMLTIVAVQGRHGDEPPTTYERAAQRSQDVIVLEPPSPGSVSVTVPSVCDSSGLLLSVRENGMGSSVTWRVKGELEEVAASVVRDYRAQTNISHAYDGYLDLLGRVWSLTVSSDEGWSEMVVVDARGSKDDVWELADDAASPNQGVQEDETCDLTVVRLGANEGERET